MYRHVYVWDIPVRVLHWAHVASTAVLTLTGYYIGNPFIVVSGENAQMYLMGWVRAIHFIAAFVFTLGFLMRGYWSFFGNQYASWRYWVPVDRERRGFLKQQLKYYLFLSRERPKHVGHNPFAGLTYTALGFTILAQSFTGFALYAESSPDGLWQVVLGWLLTLFGNQFLRLVHHVLMWLFVVFSLIHLYMAVLSDLEGGDASITSIISGIKFQRVQEEG